MNTAFTQPRIKVWAKCGMLRVWHANRPEMQLQQAGSGLRIPDPAGALAFAEKHEWLPNYR